VACRMPLTCVARCRFCTQMEAPSLWNRMSLRQLWSRNPCQTPSIFHVPPCHSGMAAIMVLCVQTYQSVVCRCRCPAGVLLVVLCVYYLWLNTALSSPYSSAADCGAIVTPCEPLLSCEYDRKTLPNLSSSPNPASETKPPLALHSVAEGPPS
jgi:hypothetical protein